ncbi:PilW family protein [Ramlibacter sp. MMS24-I3-19]|uniref:PilW family protein n=1 Tax=Ramlibacter sp. MMS24-I3-19 TaxID=3416606 RepID=UPI003CFF5CB2
MQGQGGFTLVELMVGVLIGLLASLAVAQVLINAENQKRVTTSGSDAQVNGAVALDTLVRAIQPAGYGFAANPNVLGCPLSATYNNAAVANFPAALVPVTITQGASGAPDSIRVLASGKRSLALPIRIVAPGYVAGGASFPVASTISVDGPQPDAANPTVAGELLVAVKNGSAQCELFQVTAPPVAPTDPANPPTIDRANGGWNAVNQPAQAYSDGDSILNLGTPVDRTFSITNDSLRQNMLLLAANGAPSYTGANELFAGIVNLKAEYGKDTDANGSVDTWDNTTPTTNAGWRQVLAVRLAVVARAAQYTKEKVTLACPTWNGNSLKIPGSSTCTPASSVDEDWMHYRYKVFDTVVPLRNLLWNS